MTKIVFVVLGELSSGELTIAYEFASRLPNDIYDTYFLIPEKNKSFLDDRGIKNKTLSIWEDPQINKKNIDKFINEVNPDFFIISDVYTMEYAQSWTGLNFAALKEYRIPIICIDEYEYTNAGYTVDYYGSIIRNLPPLIEQGDYILCNCPFNKKREESESRIKYFSLYGEKLMLDESKKKQVRERFKVEDDEKIIFTAGSRWEMLNVHRLPALGMFLKWMPVILQNYISALNRKITVIHVSPTPWNEFESDLVRYHHFNYLPPSEFDLYLLASDLFVTLNVVSVTLSKAVYGAVPSVVFQNHKIIDFNKLSNRLSQMPHWYREMAQELKIAYPFRAGVFGWHRLLKTALEDNPYTQTYIEAPFFKVSEAISALEKYLYDQTAIEELKQRQLEYVDKMLELPTPDEVMRSIMSDT